MMKDERDIEHNVKYLEKTYDEYESRFRNSVDNGVQVKFHDNPIIKGTHQVYYDLEKALNLIKEYLMRIEEIDPTSVIINYYKTKYLGRVFNLRRGRYLTKELFLYYCTPAYDDPEKVNKILMSD